MGRIILCSEDELKNLINTSVKNALHSAEHIPKVEEGESILNAKQAAALLKIAISTLYTKTSRSELPFFKRGKKLLFKKSELLEWIGKGKYKSQSELDQIADDYINSKTIKRN